MQLSTDRRWKACTLYTTLEPCVLCVAAASVATLSMICFAGAEIFSGSSNLASIDLGIPRPLDLALTLARERMAARVINPRTRCLAAAGRIAVLVLGGVGRPRLHAEVRARRH